MALHAQWRDLRPAGGDVFEWTTTDLLRQLRGIEWDLQDLEDMVSIVRGERHRTDAQEADMEARDRYIHAKRTQMGAVQEELEAAPLHGRQSATGYATRRTASPLSGRKAHAHVALTQEDPLAADEEADGPAGGARSSPPSLCTEQQQGDRPARAALLGERSTLEPTRDPPLPNGYGCCPGFLLRLAGR